MGEEKYMTMALELAKEAYASGEVPVGCVIVLSGKVIGRGRNRREEKQSALLHAEIEAIGEACSAIASWRLTGCDLYVTLEPCPMCAGAILNSRISRVFYGASDTAMGACGGVINIFEEAFGYKPLMYKGLLEEECSSLLSGFFKQLRR
ncbi:MAG: nucleoside deaminase [Clostridiaceae bacterium]|nr:nucleoside deaminase [Clostridiaceae bacterium]